MIKPEVILLIRILVLVFMSILFVQSAMDKVMNYRSNQQFIEGYFGKSIFKGQTKILLFLLTLLECSAALLCLAGIFFSKNIANPIGFYGLFLCSLALLSIFLGQRLAKDYAGAANIPGYFILCIIGLITYLV